MLRNWTAVPGGGGLPGKSDLEPQTSRGVFQAETYQKARCGRESYPASGVPGG